MVQPPVRAVVVVGRRLLDLEDHVLASQVERRQLGRDLRRPADRSEPGQHAGPGIGGPLADRGERP